MGYDWQVIAQEVKHHYSPGSSAVGQNAYWGLLLFKRLLVGYWMGRLSDQPVEEAANENLSVMRFLGLNLEDPVPDHSVLSRFRSHVTQKGTFEKLLNKINAQLEFHQVVVKTSVKVDASLTDTPDKPKSKSTYQIVEDRKEESRDVAKQVKETNQ